MYKVASFVAGHSTRTVLGLVFALENPSVHIPRRKSSGSEGPAEKRRSCLAVHDEDGHRLRLSSSDCGKPQVFQQAVSLSG